MRIILDTNVLISGLLVADGPSVAAGLRDFSLFCGDLPSGAKAPDPKDSYLLTLAEASDAEFFWDARHQTWTSTLGK